ncbi:MAG: T9SS type A sorting domain-containing protein [Bacteroidia bacterium]|jgi:hypothetical protein|nr:T9SS type A sorting domain-containing protein [Bacteroidia bacterium]
MITTITQLILRTKSWLMALLTITTSMVSYAQVNVTATSGTLSQSYPTIKQACDSINSGYHMGIITIGISSNTIETATATLVGSGTGAASYRTILITPTGGATRVITGNFNGPLIELNGADSITINGLNTGGNNLVLQNTNIGSLATVLQLSADAQANNCIQTTFKGSGVGTSIGVITFTSGILTGNDNNNIINCTIEESSGGNPSNGIISIGSTTAGLENSNNYIGFNSVANFFNATASSNGILLGAGNTNNTITNNRLFQSATRTYTIGATHRAIGVLSGNQNRVDSNIIGYASPTKTGIYTMAGTVISRFIGIELQVGSTVASSVQGNEIASISLNTSYNVATGFSSLGGIVITGGSVNIGNLQGNIIGSTTGTGSITVNCSSSTSGAVGINVATTGAVNIQNNTIASIAAVPATSTIVTVILGINISAVASSLIIQNNTIGNNSADNLSAGVLGVTTANSQAVGILFTSTPNLNTITGNTIQNLSSFGTGVSGFARGIATGTSGVTGADMIITNNTVSNITGYGPLANIGSGLLAVTGIHCLSPSTYNISGNTVFNIRFLGVGTTQINVGGIIVAAATTAITTTNKVHGNTIYGIVNNGSGTSLTAPSVAFGIGIRSGNNVIEIANNMISLGSGQSTNTTFIGIYGNHGSSPNPVVNIYHNTINISGTVSSGGLPSFGIFRGDFSTTARTMSYDIKNNIITNTRSGGTGKHYAISNGFGATTPSSVGWGPGNSDNNVLNADSLTIGAWGSTDYTMAGWRAISTCDLNSYSRIAVAYVNAANNLRLNMGTNVTAIESGGTVNTGITVDIDNQTRPGPVGSINGGGIKPDIGADEFDGTPLDLIAPIITYNNLSIACNTGNRTVSASIVDITGVNLTGTLVPRIYYKKNFLGTWFSQPGNFVSGNSKTSNWDFTIVSADMGVLNTFDSVYYFIIAQDSGASAVNVGSMPNGAVASNVNTITSFPSINNSYVIGFNFNGNYTLNGGLPNSSTNFQNLFELQRALSNGCISAASEVDFNAASGPYSGALNINALIGSSPTNILRLNGNGSVINHTPVNDARHIIRLNGADYINFSNFTINGLSTDFGWGFHLLNEATNDSIINCTINLSSVTSTTVDNSACIAASASSTDINLGGNNTRNLTVINSKLIGGYQSVVINGAATQASYYNQFINDTIMDFYSIGIELTNNDSTIIRNCDISRMNRVIVTTFEGIELGVGNRKVWINANRIHDSHNSATTQSGTAYGIFSTGNDAPIGGENVITNNLIYNLNSLTGIIYAIYNSGSDGVRYLHNTVTLTHAAATSGTTRGFFQTTLASNIEFRNNLIFISRGGTGVKHCVYFGTTTSSIIANHNNYYLNAPSGTNSIGYYGSDFATLNDWKTANSNAYDQQSRNNNPAFVSIANDNYTPTSSGMNNGGSASSILTDILGSTRSATTPDIGAFEYSPPPLDSRINWVGPVAPSTSGTQTITVSVTNISSAAVTITDLELAYTDGSTTQTQTFSNLNITQGATQQLSFSSTYNFTTSTNFTAYISSVNGGLDGNQTNDTIRQSLCPAFAGGTYTINNALPTGGSNFASFSSAFAALSCGISGPVIFNVDPTSGPYTEQVVIPEIAGITASTPITVNGNNRTLQFTPTTAARHIIQINGADYLTIKDLNIVGLATDFGWAVHLTNGAQFDSLINCTINLNAVTSTTVDNSACIVASSSTTDINAGGLNAGNFTVKGCTLIGAYHGIILNGNGSSTTNNNKVLNNVIRDFHAIGVEFTQLDNSMIAYNDISRANRVAVGSFEGITIGSGVRNVRVNANKIHDTHNSATTQSGLAYGIYSTASDAVVGQENIFSNNVIYNLNSLTGTVYGIYNNGSDGAHYFYNTVDISNTLSTAGLARGFYQLSAASNIVFRNNIVTIGRGGSGAKNCIYLGTTTSTVVSNNNLLTMNSTTGTVGVGYFGSNFVSLNDWKTANSSAYDQLSITGDPLYNSATNFIVLPGSPAIGAGVPISVVTTDHLDVNRGTTTTTVGAYENGGDFIPPTINFVALSNTSSTNNRVLTAFANITDITGVNITTNRPRIYYKKSTDANAYNGNTSSDNGWKYTESTNTSSPFNFTIDYSILFGGGVLPNDVINYFVVAQDISPNNLVGVSSGTFATNPANSNLTSAAFPITGVTTSYTIVQSLSGTYTVGSSNPVYPNLNAVAADLAVKDVVGHVIFELQSDYNGVNEITPINFPAFNSSSGNWTVTIRPAAGVSNRETSGYPNSTAGVIILNGANRYTLDGRAGGIGTTSDWLIRAKRGVSSSVSAAVELINGAQRNTITYLTMESDNTSTTSGVVEILGTNNLVGNSFNLITNNIIRSRTDSAGVAAIGIYSAGNASNFNDSNIITNNQILDWNTAGVHVTSVGNGINWRITNNNFYMTSTRSGAQTSIRFEAGANSTGLRITDNFIGGSAINAGSAAWVNTGNIAFRGIVCSASTSDSAIITNNVIQNIVLTGGTGTFTGIEMTGARASIRNNTIGHATTANSIQTSQLGIITGIWFNNSNNSGTIRNNIISNLSSTGNTTAVGVNGVRITSGVTTVPLLINGNTISNITAANPTTANTTASLVGILSIYAGIQQDISNNTISNLINVANASTNVFGINVTNTAGAGVIQSNTVNNLDNKSGNANAQVVGIHLDLGSSWVVRNNMISLGSLIDSSCIVSGIQDKTTGTNNSIFHNTVLISGVAVSSSATNSFGYRRTTTSTSNVRNNIFMNTRTGGIGNYAIGNVSTSPSTGWSANFNVLQTNNASTGLWNTTPLAFANWKTTSLQDSSSIQLAVQFVSTDNLHLTSTSIGNMQLAAPLINSVVVDFDGEVRNTFATYMGADEIPANPLPVKLSLFTANRLSDDAVLNWQTTFERNSNRFEILASTDGNTFEQIATVKAKGNSTTIINYRFTHVDAKSFAGTSGIVYYQLKSIDNSGNFEYSKAVLVKFDNTLTTFEIYPNPAQSMVNIKYHESSPAVVQIINMNGVELSSFNIQQNTTIDISNLPEGTYLIKVISGGEVAIKKLIKLN